MAGKLGALPLSLCGAYKTGDEVLTVKPWVSTIHWHKRSSTCGHCLKTSSPAAFVSDQGHAPSLCSGCRMVAYCHRDCQKAHWATEHKHECAMLKKIHQWLLHGGRSPLKDQTEDSLFVRKVSHVLLVAKILIKTPSTDTHPGFQGRSAQEAFDELQPGAEQRKTSIMNDLMTITLLQKMASHCLGKDIDNDEEERWMNELYDKVQLHSQPMYPLAGCLLECTAPVGVALYFETTEMTRACEPNVAFKFVGRNLVVQAAKDLAGISGLSDLAYSDNFITKTPIIRAVREAWYLYNYGLDGCPCDKCSNAVEAEVNPLKCTNASCTAALPSDERSLQPCPQCGTENPQSRLTAAQTFLKRQAKATVDMFDPEKNTLTYRLTFRTDVLERLLAENQASNVIHPDNYFRFFALFQLAMRWMGCSESIKVWKHGQQLSLFWDKFYGKNSLQLGCIKAGMVILTNEVSDTAQDFVQRKNGEVSCQMKDRSMISVLMDSQRYTYESNEIARRIFGKDVMFWKVPEPSEDDQRSSFFGDLDAMSPEKRKECLERVQETFATAYGVGENKQPQKFSFTPEARAAMNEFTRKNFVQQTETRRS